MDYDLNWLVTDYGTFLAKYGLEEKSIREHYSTWSKQTGSISAKDYLWYLFQVLLGETAKQVTDKTDLEKNNLELYTAMWFFQTHVEGKKAAELQLLINDTKIRLWQLQLPYYFRIRLEGDACCDYCDQFHGQLFSAQNLLNHDQFSPLDCTNEQGCTCTITPLAERDQANQIILKT